jgi:hypothetical protein
MQKSINQQLGAMAKRRMSRIALPAALLLGLATAGFAGNNPSVFTPGSTPFGKSYNQWVVAWWQWALGVPAANNPWFDTTGAYAGVNQKGDVWFLGSSPGNSIDRTLTIPADKGIFMPVYLWLFGSCAGDCDPSNPGVHCDVPTLQASAAAAATSIQTMEVTLDGKSIVQLQNYRATSGGGFSATLPDNNVPEVIFGLPTPAGTYSPQVADGYYLMFKPLATGHHTITVHLVPNPAYGSEQFLSYHITVPEEQ